MQPEYFPITIPANTLIGRVGNGAGATEAIPFATIAPLIAALIPTPVNTRSITIPSLLDLINDPTIVAGIQAGTYHSGLDAYFSIAIGLGGTWFLPAGSYYLNSTIVMAPGVTFIGAGIGNTTIYTSPGANPWGIEMLNPNGTTEIEAFKLSDMTILTTGNSGGVRWNSSSGGFTDDNTSQDYMMRPMLKRVYILQDASFPNTNIGVQMNKCFDGAMEDCFIGNFGTGVHFKGTDLSRITHNRLMFNSVCAMKMESVGTFGSGTFIEHNDILQPGLSGSSSASALITSDRDGHFCNNYIEGFASVTDAIQVTGGFNHKINDNRIEWDNATNVLRVRSSAIAANALYGLEFCNNHTTDQMGEIVWEGNAGYYFTNSAKRAYIKIENNTARNNLIPFNSLSDDNQTPGYHAFYTAGRKGVAVTGISTALQCQGGFFILPANADTSKYIEFSDLANDEDFPANVLKANATVEICAVSATNGQVLSWEAFDGASSVASGTITLNSPNRMFVRVVVDPSINFTTNCKIRVWNADTGSGGLVSVKSVGVKYDGA